METWWGRRQWHLDQTLSWDMADTQISVTRIDQEWQIRISRPEQGSEDNYNWRFIGESAPLGADAELIRHVCGQTTEQLQLLPLLADRPVVVRPAHPIYIAKNIAITLYISTPLWMTFKVDWQSPSLLDTPITRPSDTWFGPNTREGEICYGTRVFGRIRLNELTQRPFRAVTPVRIINNTPEVFALERLAVPVQFLPLYVSDEGRLWTPTLEVTRESNAQNAEVRISRTVDRIAGHTSLLSPPRIPLGNTSLTRALDMLFATRSH